MAKISVMGAGSWGLALAMLFDHFGQQVKVWSVFEEEAKKLAETRENTKGLKGVKIPESIEITYDTEYAIKDADIVILAVASPYTRSTAKTSSFCKRKSVCCQCRQGHRGRYFKEPCGSYKGRDSSG